MSLTDRIDVCVLGAEFVRLSKRHHIIDRRDLDWVGRDHQNPSSPTPLQWSRTSSIRSDCPEPHPSWPWVCPGMGHPLPLWSKSCCFTSLIVKNFLKSNLNWASFSLKPLTLVLSQDTLLKCLSLSFLQAFFGYQKGTLRSPQSLLFPKLNNTNSLCLSSQERCSCPLIIFLALLWTHSNMPFLCWGLDTVPKVGSHESAVERKNHLPQTTAYASLMQPRNFTKIYINS